MIVPEAFTPAALTAGILANIASEIIKHHAQDLDGTLVGRILKGAGLIEPNFAERLRDNLSSALELYFGLYPQYRLRGIEAFFRDPVTAQQLSEYILNRRPIDPKAIQHALDQHLGSDSVTKALIRQRGLDGERIVPDFLDCYRQVLAKQLDTPQVALLLEIIDLKDSLISEIQTSQEKLIAVVEQNLAETMAIRHHLGLDRPESVIVRELHRALDAAPRGGIFEPGGLCDGYPLEPRPDRFFVAQEFSVGRTDLRTALTLALARFGVQPISAEDFSWSSHILCKISALIQGTPFGVYQLTASRNRNVYLELGIAIGLGRAFVLVKDADADVSSLVQGLEYYPIESYLELRYELGEKLEPFLAQVGTYHPASSLPPPASRSTVVIAHGNLDVIDCCVPAARASARHGLLPVILGDPTGKLAYFLRQERIEHRIVGDVSRTRLDQTVAEIQAAQCGIYRVDAACDADAFLALGIAMGLNRPWLPVRRAGSDLPSDLKGLVTCEFRPYGELELLLSQELNRCNREFA